MAEGDALGLSVGDLLGSIVVGEMLGSRVVGEILGPFEGEAVGFRVGD